MRVIHKYLIGAFLLLLSVVALCNLASSASADTHTWDAGGGADTTFDNPLNWQGDSLPEAADDVVLSSGTMTFDANSVVRSFTMNGGTLTGSTSYTLTCSGNFVHGGGTMTVNALTLKMVTSGSAVTVLNGDVFYKLWFAANTTLGTSVAGVVSAYPTVQVDAGVVLTLTSGTVLSHSCYVSTWTNNGVINGPGQVKLELRTTDWNQAIGAVNADLTVDLKSNANGSKVFALPSDVVLGGQLTVTSLHATYTCTLDLNGRSLTANGITVGTRGVLLGGEGIITNAGSWDSSAGTWTPETSRYVSAVGPAKTIKMAAGQTLYDWSISNGTTVMLLSNVTVTHAFEPWGTVVPGSYSVSYSNLALMFLTEPGYELEIGSLYNYQPRLSFEALRSGWSYSFAFNTTELSGNTSTGLVMGRPGGLGPLAVSIRASDQFGNVAYQNYTLNVVNPEGYVTDQTTLDLMVIIIALLVTLAIAMWGLMISRPIVTMVAGLFAFVVIAAMLADIDYQGYWWLSIIPLANLLMFALGMRR